MRDITKRWHLNSNLTINARRSRQTIYSYPHYGVNNEHLRPGAPFVMPIQCCKFIYYLYVFGQTEFKVTDYFPYSNFNRYF